MKRLCRLPITGYVGVTNNVDLFVHNKCVNQRKYKEMRGTLGRKNFSSGTEDHDIGQS